MTLDLGKFKETQFQGTIKEVEVMPLEEHLGDRAKAFREKMRVPDRMKKEKKAIQDEYLDARLKADVLVVTYDIDGVARQEFVNIPMRSGYPKSTLKKVIDKNGLPFDHKLWKGLIVWCQLDANGYYELSK